MIEITAESAHFDALREHVAELNEALERELRAANHRIGQRLSAEARKLIQSEIYDVPIPLLASANRTFDLEQVPRQLRPFVVKAGQQGPGSVRVRFKRKLSEAFLEEHFATSRQTRGGEVFRQWRRTGNLLARERYVLDLAGRGVFSVILVNDAAYAAARSALGGPNPPNRAGRKAGVQRDQAGVPERERSKTRPVRWQVQAVTLHADWIKAQYHDAIERAIERQP